MDDQRDYAEEAFNQDLLDNPDPGVETEQYDRLPPAGDEDECLDRHKGGCQGKVLLRPSLTGTGLMIPRCDAHWEARLDWQEEHEQVYPDSPIPPAWFDPEAAGERWDDD